MITRSTSFSVERARVRSVSASATFTFSTQWESMPWPWSAQAARLCCGSASSTMTLWPMAANSAARLPAMVDLPTPPFCPATAMIAIEVGITIIPYSGAVGAMQASISELRSDAQGGALCHLLAGSGGGEFLLGFLLLAGQARLAALGELGDLDFSWGSCRFRDYRHGGRDFAFFFFLLLFGHENPSSLCCHTACGGAAAITPQLSDSFGLELYWLAESAGGGSSESGLSGWPELHVPTGYRRCSHYIRRQRKSSLSGQKPAHPVCFVDSSTTR